MNHTDDELYIICDEDYFKGNRHIARYVGLTAAVLLTEIISKRHYHMMRGEITDCPKNGPGWIYFTLDDVEYKLGLSKDEQSTAINRLKRAELLETTIIGLPAKRHFRLNTEKILELYGLSKTNSSFRKSRKLERNFESSLENDQISEIIKKQNLECGNPENLIAEKPQTGPYIYNKTIDKTNNIYAPPKGDANCENLPSFSSKKPQKPQKPTPQKNSDTYSPIENVTVSKDEHEKLISCYGEDLVNEGYADLAEWKESADPKTVAKHKSDYRRLRKWVIPNLIEEKQKNDRLKQNKIAPHRRGSKLVTPGDYDDFEKLPRRS